jgi:hypothetical protein
MSPEKLQRAVCAECLHFRTAPEQAPYTGCWHPDNMRQRQSEAYLEQQQLPGDHTQINLRGDCPQFEKRPPKKSLWRRMLDGEF